jgi:hypothetical protein
MPLPDFTEEERAEIIQAIRAAIDGDRYVLSPRVRRLKSALAKLDPASAERRRYAIPAPEAIRGAEPGLSTAERWPATALARRQPSSPTAYRVSIRHQRLDQISAAIAIRTNQAITESVTMTASDSP